MSLSRTAEFSPHTGWIRRSVVSARVWRRLDRGVGVTVSASIANAPASRRCRRGQHRPRHGESVGPGSRSGAKCAVQAVFRAHLARFEARCGALPPRLVARLSQGACEGRSDAASAPRPESRFSGILQGKQLVLTSGVRGSLCYPEDIKLARTGAPPRRGSGASRCHRRTVGERQPRTGTREQSDKL